MAKESALSALGGEKRSFCNARHYPFNFTVPVTFNKKEYQLECAYLQDGDHVSHAVYFMSVCMMALPNALQKAEEMFYFFKGCWQYPIGNIDGTLTLPSFKLKADAYMNNSSMTDAQKKARQAFVDKVEAIRIAIEPQIQLPFKSQIGLSELRKFEALIRELDRQNAWSLRQKQELEAKIEKTETEIGVLDKKMADHIASNTDEQLREPFELFYNAYKRARK